MDQKYIDRAETYLKGALTEDAHRKFEQDLNTDPELKLAYDQCRLAMDVVDRQVEVDLQAKFRQWSDKQYTGHFQLSKYPYLKIAASIALLIGVYFVFFQQSPTLSHEQLAIEFYDSAPTPDRTMGDEDELWASGIEAYNQQQYQAAIDAWSQIVYSSHEVNYYLAHAYFNDQDYQAAIPIFENLSTGSSIYNFIAEWHLALCYLANSQPDMCTQQLNQIMNQTGHPFQAEARELQEEIETNPGR